MVRGWWGAGLLSPTFSLQALLGSASGSPAFPGLFSTSSPRLRTRPSSRDRTPAGAGAVGFLPPGLTGPALPERLENRR